MKQFISILILCQTAHLAAGQSGYELGFSTYIGGNGYEQVRDVTSDDSGYIYITGGTSSSDFPTTPGAYAQSLNTSGRKIMDAFVMKFDAGGKLIWSTLVGGPEYDRAYAIEVDGQGNVLIAGRAGAGLPVTTNTFQPVFAGDTNKNKLYGQQDGFVAKISADGKRLIWNSYFGAADRGFIRDLALDSNDNVYVVITEASAYCPHVSRDAAQPKPGGGYDGIVAKISHDGSRVVWASYIGGRADDMIGPSLLINSRQEVVFCGTTQSGDMPVTKRAFDKSYHGGEDMFVGILSNDGKHLLAGSYLGGRGADGGETHNLVLDGEDCIIIAATTSSADFPVTTQAWQPAYGGSGGKGNGMYTNYPHDGFVAKLSPDCSDLLAATYLGGSAGEGLEGAGVDSEGNIYCSGSSFSHNLPHLKNSIQPGNKGAADQIMASFSPDLSRLYYLSYLGGGDNDYGRTMHVDRRGNIYIAGETSSHSFPAVNRFKGGPLDGTLSKLRRK